MRNTLPLSSFPLQALLAFQRRYQVLFSLIFFLLLLYKTFNLPYTAPMMAQQGIVQALYFIVMMLRIRGGIIANKTENSSYMIGFIVVTILSIVMGVYFLAIQYYLLLIQMLMTLIMLICNGFELIFGFFSCWQFQSYEKQQ